MAGKLGSSDTAKAASKVTDSGNGTQIGLQYSGNGVSAADWLAVWDGYNIKAMAASRIADLHNHDGRYYTESEIDSKLSGKASTSHTHNAVAGYTFDLATANTTDTWMLVQKNMTIQHRDISTLPFLPLDGGTVIGGVTIISNNSGATSGMRARVDDNMSFYGKHGTDSVETGFTYNASNKALYPWADNVSALGWSSRRWKQIYAGTSAISTSDRNLKQDISPLSDKYLQFFALLQPVAYRFIDGNNGRIHVGFVSQDVETAMEQAGLSDLDFAGFCKDVKQKQIITKRTRHMQDADGNPLIEEYEDITYEDELDADGTPVYIYSLRYEEFIALNTAMLQHQQRKIESLEDRVAKMERLVSSLTSA